jgi:EmrB/QacA subfamily drug resistance transporter
MTTVTAAAASPRAADSQLSTRRGLLILLLLCGAQFLVVLDATIVNVALPSIERALHFTEQNLQWVASGYALTFAGFLLLGGRSADRLGRRRIFMAGVLLFIAASLTGGLAVSSGMLIGARLVQGLGGAMMSPAALSLLTTSFQGKDRAKALGIYGSIGGAGGAAGVLFGGLLTSGPGWRWVLFVNVPLGIAVVLAAPRLVSGERRASRLRDLDAPGALLVTGALLLLVYGLTRAPAVGWSSARTIAEFAGAAALLVVFAVNEARSARALLPLRTFRLPGVASANGAALLQFSAVIPVFFFLTLYLQQVLGYSALRAGLAFLPLAAGVILIAPTASRLVSRLGPAPTLIAGPLVFAGGLVYLSRLPVHGTYLAGILPGLVMVAAGAGLGFVSIINAATRGVPRGDAGVAAGLVNTMQRVGSSVGLAVLTAVATARTRALAAPGHQVAAVVGGFDRAFLVAAGFAAAASLLSLVTARTRRFGTAAALDSEAPVVAGPAAPIPAAAVPAPAAQAHANAA